LILFGLLKGFLRKLHKYPITLQETQAKNEEEKKWLTGFLNFDNICSSLGKTI